MWGFRTRTQWSRVFTVALLAGLSFATLGSKAAQAEVDLRVRGYTDPVAVQASVTIESGSPIKDLTQTQFQVVENGVERPVTAFLAPASQSTTDPISLSVVFVMDYSGSLSNADSIGPVEEAVAGFIESMNLGDQVAILKFNGVIEDTLGGFAQVDPADTGALVSAARTDLAFHEESLVYDALMQAIDLMEGSSLPEGPKAVILLSDGRDTDSVTTQAELEARILETGTQVFTVGFGNPDADIMNAIAQVAGTEYVASQDGDGFHQVHEEIGTLLQNEYTLTYDSAVAPDDCSLNELVVTVDAGLPTEQVGETTFRRCPIDNTAPSVTPVDRRTYGVGVPVELQIQANDLEGDDLTYLASGLCPGLAIDSASGLISGTPTSTGTCDGRVTVSDGEASSSIAFTIDVVEPVSDGGGSGGGGGGFGPLGALMAMLAAVASVALRRRT